MILFKVIGFLKKTQKYNKFFKYQEKSKMKYISLTIPITSHL